jgi:HSP20 family protein
MANIVRKGEGTPVAHPRGIFGWDPFRLLTELTRWDPFREPTAAYDERAGGFIPTFDVKETKDGFLFKADLPGVKESELDISVSGNRLTISGKRESEAHEEGDTYYTYERSFGSFARSFTLPEGVDPETIEAELKSGVLSLLAHKKAEAQPKKVTIKGMRPTDKEKAKA